MLNYSVNNLSYLSMHKENSDFLSANKVDNVTVALNFDDNKAYKTDEIIEKLNATDFKFDHDDLLIHNIKVDEYENGFNNILISFRSKDKKELLGLSMDFNNNKCILLYNVESNKLEICYDISKLMTIKKAYPVLIPLNEDDQYIMHHNFFAGSMYVYNTGVKYVMELITPRTHQVIQELLWKKFNEFNLVADSLDELISTFYYAFTDTDSNKDRNLVIEEIDKNILEYGELIKSYQGKIRLLEERKEKLLI